jgi:hypothetical protein
MSRYNFIGISVKCSILLTVLAPLALIWGEIFTRILLPQNLDSGMNIFKSDPVIGFTYAPNATTYEKGREYNAFYQINSNGLRDREYGTKKIGLFRVLLLGDSFSVSHGLPIEESLSRQLEHALQELADSDKINVKIEVVNTAVGGYSPYNYWKAYQRWASVYEPDAVIVGLSPDDYDCRNEYMKYLIEGGETLSIFKSGQDSHKIESRALKGLRKWLSWNSELYILMRNFLYYNDYAGKVVMWFSAKDAEQVSQLEQYIVPQSESMSKAWEKTFSYLGSIKQEATTDGVVMLVVSIPMKLEIDRGQYIQALEANGLTPQQIDIDQPLKGLSIFCKDKNIPILDPRAALRTCHEKMPCYFVYDGHWIAEGIRVSADSIAKQWRDLKLPPWDK